MTLLLLGEGAPAAEEPVDEVHAAIRLPADEVLLVMFHPNPPAATEVLT